MSLEVTKAFVQNFHDDVIHLSQQDGSVLMGTVRTKDVVGKYDHFDRLAATKAVKRTSRHGDTPRVDVPHSRRRLIMSDYEWSELIDKADAIRMLIDFKSPYAEAAAMALGRSMDDEIIAAFTGNAQSIDADDASANVALPAGQIVDEDFGAADSNLTIKKLIEARRVLRANNINLKKEELYCVINASAEASLLNTTEVTSADYNSVKALVRGEIDTFLGFKFIHTEALLGTADGTDTDPVLCIAYAKSGMGLGIGQSIQVRVDELPTKSYSTQVFASMSLGATRIEDEKVVSIQCVQAA